MYLSIMRSRKLTWAYDRGLSLLVRHIEPRACVGITEIDNSCHVLHQLLPPINLQATKLFCGIGYQRGDMGYVHPLRFKAWFKILYRVIQRLIQNCFLSKMVYLNIALKLKTMNF